MALAVNAASPLNTPTYDGSGESVHPSVVDAHEIVGQDWSGYRYWMGITPYQGGNNDLENPSILASSDGTTWVVPAGVTNPIVPLPTDSGRHNSDTDLLLEPDGSSLHMFYRESGTGTRIEEDIYLTSSSDGVNWSAPTLLFSTGDNGDNELFLSPASVKAGGSYHLYAVVGGGRGIAYRSASSVTGPWSSRSILRQGAYGGLEPWHISCRLEKNGAIRFTLHVSPGGQATGGEIWASESPGPGADLQAVGKLLNPTTGWDENLYRGCMVPLNALGSYGLYYSARSADNAWRTGYTDFSGPAPVYAGSESGTTKTIDDVDDGVYEVRVRSTSISGDGSWSQWVQIGGTVNPGRITRRNLTRRALTRRSLTARP